MDLHEQVPRTERVGLTRTALAAVVVVSLLPSCSWGNGREHGGRPQRRPVSLSELALHPNRWVARRVVVEGQLYKFPGNQVSSAKVQDQLVCDRIARFPPGGRGSYCIVFWGVRVQDVRAARRSPDDGWWVKSPVRLAGKLRGFPYSGRPVDRVALAATGWRRSTRQ